MTSKNESDLNRSLRKMMGWNYHLRKWPVSDHEFLFEIDLFEKRSLHKIGHFEIAQFKIGHFGRGSLRPIIFRSALFLMRSTSKWFFFEMTVTRVCLYPLYIQFIHLSYRWKIWLFKSNWSSFQKVYKFTQILFVLIFAVNKRGTFVNV